VRGEGVPEPGTTARNAYFSSIINLNRNNPKFHFDTVMSLTQKQTRSVGSSLLAGQFMDFFENKITLMREKMILAVLLVLRILRGKMGSCPVGEL
jgi:hypothetical protein